MREKIELLIAFAISGLLIVTILAFGISARISESEAVISLEKGIAQPKFLIKRPMETVQRDPRPSGQFKPFPTPTFVRYPKCETISCLDEGLDRQRP